MHRESCGALSERGAQSQQSHMERHSQKLESCSLIRGMGRDEGALVEMLGVPKRDTGHIQKWKGK